MIFFYNIFFTRVYAGEIDKNLITNEEINQEITLFFTDYSIRITNDKGEDFSSLIRAVYSPSEINLVMEYLIKNKLSIVRQIPSDYIFERYQTDLNNIIHNTYKVKITSFFNVYGNQRLTIEYYYTGTLSFDTINKKITSFHPTPTLLSFRGSLPVEFKVNNGTYVSLGHNAQFLKFNINFDFYYVHLYLDTHTRYLYRERRTYDYYPQAY